MERKLATIQKILDIKSVEKADTLEVATVMGWQVVVGKDEFKIGDYIIYCEVDSFLPVAPWSEFLRKGCYRENPILGEGMKIKTITLRGQISQGLIFPLDILPQEEQDKIKTAPEKFINYSVAEILNIRKWESGVESDVVLGDFPSFIPKSDEMRIQSALELLDEIKGKSYYISQKQDGTSCTCYLDEEKQLHVCGHTRDLKKVQGNFHYWQVAEKYNLKDKIDGYGVQFEVCGPGVQNNKLGLSQLDGYIFSIYDLKNGQLLNLNEMSTLAFEWGMPTVPILEVGDDFNYTLDELLEKAKGNYDGGKKREGIVIRTQEYEYSAILGGKLSFKVINNDFLLKEK